MTFEDVNPTAGRIAAKARIEAQLEILDHLGRPYEDVLDDAIVDLLAEEIDDAINEVGLSPEEVKAALVTKHMSKLPTWETWLVLVSYLENLVDDRIGWARKRAESDEEPRGEA